MLSTSTIQKPARNSFASANGPSVSGVPSLRARTLFASSGPASPCASTNSPEALSFSLRPSMNAMCASMSFGAQVPMPAVVQPSFGACIISMYFMALLLSRRARHGRFDGISRSTRRLLDVPRKFFRVAGASRRRRSGSEHRRRRHRCRAQRSRSAVRFSGMERAHACVRPTAQASAQKPARACGSFGIGGG